MAQIRAKLGEQVRNGKNYGDQKEVVGQYKLISVDCSNGAPKFNEPVDLRLYMGRSSGASTVYATLWVHGTDFYASGSGKASGYGYCKRSAAADSAIRAAGIELFGAVYSSESPDFEKSVRIDGVGESAMQEAIYAIGEALGYDRSNLYLVRC